jgi:hypothetical protein
MKTSKLCERHLHLAGAAHFDRASRGRAAPFLVEAAKRQSDLLQRWNAVVDVCFNLANF